MPWHDMSEGDALALVHQEDGRHLHSAPPSLARLGERAMVALDSPPFCKSFFCKPLEIFRGDF
jgi:hypothetical protein